MMLAALFATPVACAQPRGARSSLPGSLRGPQYAQAPRLAPDHSRASRLGAQLCCRAHHDGASSGPQDFSLSAFWEAKVDSVRKTERHGHVIFLRLEQPGENNLLPIYVGDFECGALVNEINKVQTMRPMTHDLMAASLKLLGFKVTKVCVTAMVGRTYHARVSYTAGPGQSSLGAPLHGEMSIDARPSDAINLAARFDAPIYVNREVAAKMAHPAADIQATTETVTEIERSCRDDIKHFPDPTLQLQLNLQLAIATEKYSEATRLRNEIDRLLVGDRALSLVVAIQSALSDKRFEEAQRLRDELRQLRTQRCTVDGSNASLEKQDA